MVDETTPVPPADDATPAIPLPPVEPAAAVAPPAVPLPPVEPAAAVAPPAPEAAPAGPAPKRRIWPFVLGGGILLFVLLLVGIGVLVAGLVSGATATPAKTVLDFDKAFATVDCDLFKKTTTTDFQASFLGEDFTCGPWEDNAKGLQVDGKYAYEVVVGKTTVDGDTAEVVTKETDSSGDTPTDYDLDYHLVKTNGAWLIDGIENLNG